MARTYSVDPTGNKLLGFTQSITGPNGSTSAVVSYTYNANGELTGNGLAQYSFDPENRLASMAAGNTDTSATTRYAHNALGQRVFKTEPVYPNIAQQPQDEGFWASLAAFFQRFWSPTTQQPEQLGWAYVYDEEGTLIGEYGSGGASSTGSSQYIWLPTPSGPLPIAAVINGSKYAIHADHLNTPRRLSNEQGQAAWQWKYSAFGDEQPTKAANRFVDPEKNPGMGTGIVSDVAFNLRYPGQYADSESGLHYNGFRSYSPMMGGRYTQPDPIGWAGGPNPFLYVGGNPLSYADPLGLAAEGATVGGAIGGAVGGRLGGSAGARVGTMIGSRVGSALQDICTPEPDKKCQSATPDNIRAVLQSSTMMTLQPSVSASHVQELVNVLEVGGSLPPIQVDGTTIVDGNHRYVAGLLCRRSPLVQAWTAPLTKPRIPVNDLQVLP